MTLRDISSLRLINQCLVSTAFRDAKSLVAWMGAMQAQDFPMSRWAIGCRLQNTSDQKVEEAINKGDLLRTHVLRPTWHLVSATDIRWMIELTAPQILTSMRSRHKQLGLSQAMINKSNNIIENALSDGYHATREELVLLLAKVNIKNEDNRAAHLIAIAELECLICSGASKGIKQTYALFDERASNAKAMSKEDALATLAKRYFQSHSPANLNDFIWWSGLSITDARHAVEAIRPGLHIETVEGKQYFFMGTSKPNAQQESFILLPAYDEFLISYKDRRPSLPQGKQAVTISSNGIFKPLIVRDGQVIGIWKRTKQPRQVLLEITFFKKPDKILRNKVVEAAQKYGQFLGQGVTVK